MLQQNNNRNNSNQLLVPQVDDLMTAMKEEIAEEFGVKLGADTSARDNGRVGGEMTRRLVKMAQEQLAREHTLH